MQERIYLNNQWFFATEGNEEIKEVRIPHTHIETPLNYFDEEAYQFVSCYSNNIFADTKWQGKHVLLTFEGVAHAAKVYVGNQLVGHHEGGYTAFTFDIAPYLEWGTENNLLVEVDSRESQNIPPFGKVVDYMTYGGIYRDVYLEIKEPSYIKEVFVRGRDHSYIEEKEVEKEVVDEQGNTTLVVEKVANELLDKQVRVDLEIEAFQEGMEVACFLRKTTEESWKALSELELKGEVETLTCVVNDIENWEIEQPVLYELKVELLQESQVVDCQIKKFGYRICEFRKDGFYLNHRKVKLVGLNRHQSYPYVGYAMPKRPQQLDADILKYELGLNAVRTSHYPQSHYFLDRCDELGLLVFTEMPGWQHIGDTGWKDAAVDMVEEMVKQYRNHPSIILWGARINESEDDDRLYRRTNKLIHSLDDSRQTGGVRCIKKSNLLEDVYTYNDFSHTGKNPGLEPKNKVTSKEEAGYLVSEYNGHMYPTKAFDSESHRLEHARRHANVLEALYKNEDIAGGFGWCMFDYNTHKDFGSGDRICYHGVMNMFRIPKLAASVYASQNVENPILEISSTMDIGEHPACNLGEIYAFTNGDSVNLYKNDVFVKSFYPNKKVYGHMPHPPILIDDFIGELLEKKEEYSHANAESIKAVLGAVAKYGQANLPLKYKLKMAKLMALTKLTMSDGTRLYSEYIGNWGGEAITYRFEAVQNGKVVKAVEKSATKQIGLKVTVDTEVLQEGDIYDVATIRIQVVNEQGAVLPYYQGVVTFETVGNIELIGPSNVSLIGGSVGTYVKSIGRLGAGVLRISGDGLEEQSLVFDIIKGE